MANKPNLGKRKITIERIKNPCHLNVTFSKRRAGFFKKAHELSTMCGAEVGLVCFSPAGKVYTYGSPNVAQVMTRFAQGGGAANPVSSATVEQNAQLERTKSQLEAAKKKGQGLEKNRHEAAGEKNWWRADLKELKLDELKTHLYAMEGFMRYAANQPASVQAAHGAGIFGLGTGSRGPF